MLQKYISIFTYANKYKYFFSLTLFKPNKTAKTFLSTVIK